MRLLVNVSIAFDFYFLSFHFSSGKSCLKSVTRPVTRKFTKTYVYIKAGGGVQYKKVFLKILQMLQESTCVGVSF